MEDSSSGDDTYLTVCPEGISSWNSELEYLRGVQGSDASIGPIAVLVRQWAASWVQVLILWSTSGETMVLHVIGLYSLVYTDGGTSESEPSSRSMLGLFPVGECSSGEADVSGRLLCGCVDIGLCLPLDFPAGWSLEVWSLCDVLSE